MREILGLLLAHAVLIGVGLVALRAVGLCAAGWRSVPAALGPALVVGVCLVAITLVVLLVIGVPFTIWTGLAVSAGWAAVGWEITRRRESHAGGRQPPPESGAGEPPALPESGAGEPPALPESGAGEQPALPESGAGEPPVLPESADPGGRRNPVRAVVLAAAGLYAAYGVYALARVPTQSDDARIWSLKGLTLTYYDSLRPEMFTSSFVDRAHPIYPLLQPVFEAVLFRSMGHPALRWFHSELWILCGAALWTVAYLLTRSPASSRAMMAWLPTVALLAIAPQVLINLGLGYADTTASFLLGAGTVALGLWLEREHAGYLAMAAVLLAGAANTKDEELLATAVILVVAGIAVLVRRRPRSLPPLAVAVAAVAAAVAPWRIWVAAHHLTDNVTPPLPRALSPVYVLDRGHELHLSLSAMLSQVLSGYGWLAAIFLGVCTLCLLTGTARRTTCFYLGAFLGVAAALLWLYTTTPLSLAFLIPTSMDRTVSAFMALSGLASAHLLAVLAKTAAEDRVTLALLK